MAPALAAFLCHQLSCPRHEHAKTRGLRLARRPYPSSAATAAGGAVTPAIGAGTAASGAVLRRLAHCASPRRWKHVASRSCGHWRATRPGTKVGAQVGACRIAALYAHYANRRGFPRSSTSQTCGSEAPQMFAMGLRVAGITWDGHPVAIVAVAAAAAGGQGGGARYFRPPQRPCGSA